MAKIQNPNNLSYEKYDVLLVEVDVRPRNYVCDLGLLRGGKNKEKFLCDDLNKLIDLIAEEEEIEELAANKKAFTVACNKKKSQLLSTYGSETSVEYQNELNKFIDMHNPSKKFFDENGKEPKPINSVTVLENLGPRPSDTAAFTSNQIKAQDKTTELISMLLADKMQMQKQLEEVMKLVKKQS